MQDMNSDGVPDVWVYYDPQNPKEVVRREEDTDHNGRVDTWSYFNQGQLVRRQVDRTGDGNIDGLFFYKDDKLVREERDEEGNGVPTYRALYEDGRLAKVEKDLDRDGRVDSWSYYDPKVSEETVVREERDFNGDGGVDVTNAVYLLSFLFSGGPPPAPPWPNCGLPTANDVSVGCDLEFSCQ